MGDLFTMGKAKIRDIKNKEKLQIYAKIDQYGVQKASNNTEFMNLTLYDDTGTINAKKWDVTEEEKEAFKMGQLVFIKGVGSEYNDKTQLIIHEMRLVNKFDDVDLSVFYPKAPVNKDDLKRDIYHYIETIENNHLQFITKTLVDKYQDTFFVFPAATKNHHAYISGLAYHVKTMLDVGKSISMIYQDVNQDLLYAGIILHDLGKVIELSDHLAPEYTKVGKLIGHINLCFEEIRLLANKKGIESEEIVLLQHLILSHHGLMEYGSPKTPMLLEAEVLHLIDLMDSRLNMIIDELDVVKTEEFTKRIYTLDGRAFYKHKLMNQKK